MSDTGAGARDALTVRELSTISLPAKFQPPRQPGLLAHALIGILLALAAVCGAALLGPTIAATAMPLPIALIVVPLILLPFATYSALTIIQAQYVVHRDFVSIKWGLRSELIPAGDIQRVVVPGTDLQPLPLPRIHWPGNLRGKTTHSNTIVEFMAADIRRLVAIQTRQQLFIISPSDRESFLRAYARAAELGNLEPVPSQSKRTASLFALILEDNLLRTLWIGATLLASAAAVGALVLTSLTPQATLGFGPDLLPLSVQANQILILPLAAYAIDAISFLTILFVSRWTEARPLAIAVAAGNLVAIGFLVSSLLWSWTAAAL